jgi:2'-5' RNA ligase
VNKYLLKATAMLLQQLSFPDFGPVPAGLGGLRPGRTHRGESRRATERYFFAVPVPRETRPALAALTGSLIARHGLSGKPRPPQNLHATVFSLGEYEVQQPELVALARRFAANIQARPFSVTWDRVRSLPRGGRTSPLVLCGEAGARGSVEGLAGLHELFRIPMIERGFIRPAARKFTPHVTLLHDEEILDEPIAPIGWRVTEFTLVHSLLGQARQIVLGRWPLRG